MKKMAAKAAPWIAFMLLSASGRGASFYTITDLGLLTDGSFSAAAGISPGGLITGYGDSGSVSSSPFLWSSGAGMSAVDTGGSPFAFGQGVNDSGVVAGYAYTSDYSSYYAFLSGVSNFTPPGSSSAALAINNAGTAVGYFVDSTTSLETGFVYAGGMVTSLGTLPGGATSRGNAINGGGTIVGEADDAGGTTHPVEYAGGAWSDLGIADGYVSGYASAVSDAGNIVGTFTDATGHTMAFLLSSDGTMTLLDALTPGRDSSAYGVNLSGAVVGSYRLPDADGTAFLYTSASGMVDLNLHLANGSGWQLTEADAINNAGQIAGTGLLNGVQHAFLLEPTTSTPEPATLPVACSALLLLAVGKYRLFEEKKP